MESSGWLSAYISLLVWSLWPHRPRHRLQVSSGIRPAPWAGVTVEASSPNLSEKVRTVVNDGGGRTGYITLPRGLMR